MSLVYKYEVKLYTCELTCIEGFMKHCRYAIWEYFDDILEQNDWKRFCDEYNSEYCLESIVSSASSVVYNAYDVLKGRRKCWYFKNKTNILVLIENRYDSETNQRMYDASAFLEALTKNGEC